MSDQSLMPGERVEIYIVGHCSLYESEDWEAAVVQLDECPSEVIKRLVESLDEDGIAYYACERVVQEDPDV